MTRYFMGFSGGSVVKNQSASAGDPRDSGLIPGLQRSLGNGNRSSILVWEIPWTEEPGRLLNAESDRTEHTRIAFK